MRRILPFLLSTRQRQSDINGAMRSSTMFAIVALLLYAVVIAAYATIPAFADAKDGGHN